MTGEGRGGGAGGDPDGRDGRSLPPELRRLDETLRRTRFGPRPGLEGDVMARLSDPDGEEGRQRPGVASPPARRRAVRAAAVLVLIGTLGLLARYGTGGGDGSGAPVVSEGSPVPEEQFTLRWGPDARVLALGDGATRERGAEGRGVRCGRVGGRLGCRGTEAGPARFATARGPTVLRDFCCLDYDGGGPADDGVRVVAGQGEAVVDFWIYEDLDGNGTFSDGDLLRTVLDGVRAGRPFVGTPGRVRRLDRCCADLDGGPHRDDGLFVMAVGGEHVALAVLYEDVTGDGRLSPGDRLRALRTTPLENGS